MSLPLGCPPRRRLEVGGSELGREALLRASAAIGRDLAFLLPLPTARCERVEVVASDRPQRSRSDPDRRVPDGLRDPVPATTTARSAPSAAWPSGGRTISLSTMATWERASRACTRWSRRARPAGSIPSSTSPTCSPACRVTRSAPSTSCCPVPGPPAKKTPDRTSLRRRLPDGWLTPRGEPLRAAPTLRRSSRAKPSRARSRAPVSLRGICQGRRSPWR